MKEVMKSFYNEVWKEIKFDGNFTNTFGLEVSNYGRVRSVEPRTGQPVKILAGSKQEGYAIIRKTLLMPQSADMKKKLDVMRKNITLIRSELTVATGEPQAHTQKAMKDVKRIYTAAMSKDRKARATNIGMLVHRLVAEKFCTKPSDAHTIVIHKDFNKLNNQYTNLQWATIEENIAHQQLNPYVKAEKKRRRDEGHNSNQKLTVTRVMLIKKRLLEGRPMRQLARQFKVTETQIARIKKGENWGHVPAAS